MISSFKSMMSHKTQFLYVFSFLTLALQYFFLTKIENQAP